MKVTLHIAAALPSRQEDIPPSVSSDTITYRGEEYDLSQLPDGAEVEAGLPFIGKIKRVNGQVEIALQYRYDAAKAEENQPSDLAAYTFVVTDGQCPCPIVRKPEPEQVAPVEMEGVSHDD